MHAKNLRYFYDSVNEYTFHIHTNLVDNKKNRIEILDLYKTGGNVYSSRFSKSALFIVAEGCYTGYMIYYHSLEIMDF